MNFDPIFVEGQHLWESVYCSQGVTRMTQDPRTIANVQAMTFKVDKKLHLRPEKWHTQILNIHSSAPNGQIDPGPFHLLFHLAFDSNWGQRKFGFAFRAKNWDTPTINVCSLAPNG